MVQGCPIALHRGYRQVKFLAKKKKKKKNSAIWRTYALKGSILRRSHQPRNLDHLDWYKAAVERLRSAAATCPTSLEEPAFRIRRWTSSTWSRRVPSPRQTFCIWAALASSTPARVVRQPTDKRLTNHSFWGHNSTTRTNEPGRKRNSRQYLSEQSKPWEGIGWQMVQRVLECTLFPSHWVWSRRYVQRKLDIGEGGKEVEMGTTEPNCKSLRIPWEEGTIPWEEPGWDDWAGPPEHFSSPEYTWLSGRLNNARSRELPDARDQRQSWLCRSSGRHWPDNWGKKAARARETAIISSMLMCSELSSWNHTPKAVRYNRWSSPTQQRCIGMQQQGRKRNL